MAKIKYTCKNCGLERHILEEWSDLKPTRCMNKKCNTSFLKNPDTLIISLPAKEETKIEQKSKKKKYDEN